MKKSILAILLTTVLTGCAVTGNYGDFSEAPTQISQSIGLDAAKKIIETYPPANTSFLINHQISEQDHFGSTLIDELRKNGFAVNVKSNQTDDINKDEPKDTTLFYYVVDSFNTNFYRVTLSIGAAKFSRAYNNSNPIGVWSKGGL